MLPPFDVRKAENYLEKKQKMAEALQLGSRKNSRKYVFDVKLFLILYQYGNEKFSHRILILLYKIKKKH